MTGLLLVVCSMMLARRLQMHDHQSMFFERGTRRSPYAAKRMKHEYNDDN